MDKNITGVILLSFMGYASWSLFFRVCKSCVRRNIKIHEVLQSIRIDGVRYTDEKIRRSNYRISLLRKAIACLPLESPEWNVLKEEESLWKNYKLEVEKIAEDFELKFCMIEKHPNLSVTVENLPKLVEIEEPVTWMNLDGLISKYHSKKTLYKVCWKNDVFKPINILGELISNLKKELPFVPERRLRISVAYIYNKYKRGIFENELKQIERLSCKMLQDPDSVLYEEYEGGVCTICQSELREEFLRIGCNHRFHPLCMNLWTEVDSYCPLCRREVKLK